MGSGSLAAMSVFESRYKPDLSVSLREKQELILKHKQEKK
jgi:20S proteasome alpha/beta subunit